eukprot:GILJ01004485.1.p1 GENE.GILJ01004485.1~~GILJ01004485.1.p1  ORF type:complete len:552 (+),score=38.79 GILJ01004485.1:191-1657(+)
MVERRYAQISRLRVSGGLASACVDLVLACRNIVEVTFFKIHDRLLWESLGLLLSSCTKLSCLRVVKCSLAGEVFNLPASSSLQEYHIISCSGPSEELAATHLLNVLKISPHMRYISLYDSLLSQTFNDRLSPTEGPTSFPNVTQVSFINTDVTLCCLFMFPAMTSLDLTGSMSAATDLHLLSQFLGLRDLILDEFLFEEPSVTPSQFIAILSTLPNLQLLSLKQTDFLDGQHISELILSCRQLQTFSFDCYQRDQSIDEVQELHAAISASSLRHLFTYYTPSIAPTALWPNCTRLVSLHHSAAQPGGTDSGIDIKLLAALDECVCLRHLTVSCITLHTVDNTEQDNDRYTIPIVFQRLRSLYLPIVRGSISSLRHLLRPLVGLKKLFISQDRSLSVEDSSLLLCSIPKQLQAVGLRFPRDNWELCDNRNEVFSSMRDLQFVYPESLLAACKVPFVKCWHFRHMSHWYCGPRCSVECETEPGNYFSDVL